MRRTGLLRLRLATWVYPYTSNKTRSGGERFDVARRDKIFRNVYGVSRRSQPRTPLFDGKLAAMMPSKHLLHSSNTPGVSRGGHIADCGAEARSQANARKEYRRRRRGLRPRRSRDNALDPEHPLNAVPAPPRDALAAPLSLSRGTDSDTLTRMDLLINIDVPNLDQAVAFYEQAFGLTATRRLGAEAA